MGLRYLGQVQTGLRALELEEVNESKTGDHNIAPLVHPSQLPTNRPGGDKDGGVLPPPTASMYKPVGDWMRAPTPAMVSGSMVNGQWSMVSGEGRLGGQIWGQEGGSLYRGLAGALNTVQVMATCANSGLRV
jgi:hypothetical protein